MVTPPREGGDPPEDADDLMVWLMNKVDEYAEASIWQAGYMPPRPKAVELTRQRRMAVERCLRSIVRDLP